MMCRQRSGNVTSIASMKENEFVTELAGQDVWLGLRSNSGKQTADDTWWSDSSPLTYHNWSESDRSHRHPSELGILQVGGEQTGRWGYELSNASFPYVCKKGRRERRLSAVALFSMACCLGYKCGSLKAPHNGNILIHNFTVGSTANFGCNEGYVLTGRLSITCQPNSLWSSSTPTCEPKPITTSRSVSELSVIVSDCTLLLVLSTFSLSR